MWKSGTPNHSALPLMEILTRMGILNPLSVSWSDENYSTTPEPTYTCAVGWTSRVMLLEPKGQTSLIWGSRPSTHWMNSGPSESPLPESEGRQMDPTESCPAILLVKLNWLEWAGQGQRNSSAKTNFESRRENQYFERQNISMSQLPLEYSPFGTNMTNRITSPFDSIPVGEKIQTPHHWHDQQIFRHWQRIYQSKNENRTYQRTRIQTHHCQNHHRTNLIRWMIPILDNQIKINSTIRKSVRNTRNRMSQTHRQAILIRPTTVTTDASNVKRRAIGNNFL